MTRTPVGQTASSPRPPAPPGGRRATVIRDLPACHGAFPFASPVRLQAAGALAGAPLRRFRRVLMLEVGTGVGLAAQAAALAGTGAEIWGQTAEPQEAAQAQALLDEAGLDATLIGADPVGLLARLDLREFELPAFDLIVMPWGWDLLDAAARAAIVDLLARRLAPGGGFQLTYSVAPGGVTETALRQLMRSRWQAAGGIGDLAGRMARTLEDAERVALSSHWFMRGASDWARTRDEMRRLPPSVFARIWGAPRLPLEGSAALGAMLARGGIAGWSPADPLRLAPAFDMTEAQRAEVERCADPFLAAETADLMIVRQTRSDLFHRAGVPTAAERVEAADLSIVAARPDLAAAIAAGVRVEGLLGPMTLARAAYLPLAEALAEGPARLGGIASRLGASPAALVERVAVLLGAGLVRPAPHGAEGPPAAAREACRRLGEALLRRGIEEVLADPDSGGPEFSALSPQA